MTRQSLSLAWGGHSIWQLTCLSLCLLISIGCLVTWLSIDVTGVSNDVVDGDDVISVIFSSSQVVSFRLLKHDVHEPGEALKQLVAEMESHMMVDDGLASTWSSSHQITSVHNLSEFVHRYRRADPNPSLQSVPVCLTKNCKEYLLYMSCKGRCGTTTISPCSCYHTCVLVGQCCHDFRLACPDHHDQAIQHLSRFQGIRSHCDPFSKHMLVSSCPHHAQEAWHIACGQNRTATNLFSILPVTDLETKWNFKSVFCWQCWNTSEWYRYWRINVNVPSHIDKDTLNGESLYQFLLDNPSRNTWETKENYVKYQCPLDLLQKHMPQNCSVMASQHPDLGAMCQSGNDSTAQHWSCRKRCQATTAFPCSCQSQCIEHENCCPDFVQFCPDLYLKARERLLLKPTLFTTCDVILRIPVVAHCPDDASNRNKKQCDARDPFHPNSLIPVVDRKTGLQFKNRYCWKCWVRSGKSVRFQVHAPSDMVTDYELFMGNVLIFYLENPRFTFWHPDSNTGRHSCFQGNKQHRSNITCLMRTIFGIGPIPTHCPVFRSDLVRKHYHQVFTNTLLAQFPNASQWMCAPNKAFQGKRDVSMSVCPSTGIQAEVCRLQQESTETSLAIGRPWMDDKNFCSWWSQIHCFSCKIFSNQKIYYDIVLFFLGKTNGSCDDVKSLFNGRTNCSFDDVMSLFNGRTNCSFDDVMSLFMNKTDYSCDDVMSLFMVETNDSSDDFMLLCMGKTNRSFDNVILFMDKANCSFDGVQPLKTPQSLSNMTRSHGLQYQESLNETSGIIGSFPASAINEEMISLVHYFLCHSYNNSMQGVGWGYKMLVTQPGLVQVYGSLSQTDLDKTSLAAQVTVGPEVKVTSQDGDETRNPRQAMSQDQCFRLIRYRLRIELCGLTRNGKCSRREGQLYLQLLAMKSQSLNVDDSRRPDTTSGRTEHVNGTLLAHLGGKLTEVLSAVLKPGVSTMSNVEVLVDNDTQRLVIATHLASTDSYFGYVAYGDLKDAVVHFFGTLEIACDEDLFNQLHASLHVRLDFQASQKPVEFVTLQEPSNHQIVLCPDKNSTAPDNKETGDDGNASPKEASNYKQHGKQENQVSFPDLTTPDKSKSKQSLQKSSCTNFKSTINNMLFPLMLYLVSQ